MIYLDNNSTTKVDKRVLEAMEPYFTDIYGNSENLYYEIAEKAKKAVKSSEKIIIQSLNCNDYNVIFTSGATEGNNHILKGASGYNQNKNHIITTNVEHSSVYNTCKYLETIGFKVTYLDVNSECQIDLNKLKEAINEQTILISIMWVNNEVGSIFPISEISKICKENGILFHSDSTQALGKIKIDLIKDGPDFLTFSGHKIYGPKGIGFTLIKKQLSSENNKLIPLIHGGNQQNGNRSGTLPVPLIVGLAKAVEIVTNELERNNRNLIMLENMMVSKLIEKLGNLLEFNNNFANRVYGTINIRIKTLNNQVFLKEISSMLAASAGSACSVFNPSRVLKFMGFSDLHISQSIRISLSPYLDVNDLKVIDEAF
jgi:cysteine desulfurase